MTASAPLSWSALPKTRVDQGYWPGGRDKHGVKFYYADFRPGYREATAQSRKMGMYRQQYCGCIYSEKERYYKPEKKGK
jgi:predicted adenine nucleotide alpha hydrolase (AANH) superfamily ATPase